MIKKVVAISCVAVLMSCGGGNEEKKTETTSTEVKDTVKVVETGPINEVAEFKFTTLAINIPSPFEIVGILPKAGISFNSALLNTV